MYLIASKAPLRGSLFDPRLNIFLAIVHSGAAFIESERVVHYCDNGTALLAAVAVLGSQRGPHREQRAPRPS